MTDPLLIPLSCLPSLPPMGAPITNPRTKQRFVLVFSTEADGVVGALDVRASSGGPCWLGMDAADWCLDLRPPDPPGSRADGLDVGLRMLGFRVESTTLNLCAAMQGGVRLLIGSRAWWPVLHDVPGDVCVPALADIDPADPQAALRLAVVAVLRGGGGR